MHIVRQHAGEIETKLIEITKRPEFYKLVAEYDRLLEEIGNVEGEEIIALVMLANSNVNSKLKP